MFIKNCWYAAARSGEIDRRLLGRILLNEPVVLFRTEEGAIVALEDRCSHRGYPLHKGRLIGDALECGYHGITFDCAGQCIKVPGQAQIPSGADVMNFSFSVSWVQRGPERASL